MEISASETVMNHGVDTPSAPLVAGVNGVRCLVSESLAVHKPQSTKSRRDRDERAGNWVSKGGRRCLGLLLILTLMRGLLYAAVVPPWQGPDETGHFEYAWLIAHYGRLPTREDISPAFEQELLASLYEWRYGEFIGRPLPEGMPARMAELPIEIHARRSRTIQQERFSLSYLWQALFLLPLRFHDLTSQLLVARLSSVLLSVVIVWLAFATFSDLVLSGLLLICAMTAVVVFLPQHTFINSMVGDGTLAELMTCLVLFCWVRLFRRGPSVWRVTGILLGTLAGIWTKTTAMFLIPLNGVLALWWFFRQPRQTRTGRYVAFACIGAAVLGVGLWSWSLLASPSRSRTLGAILESLSADGWLFVDARGITFGEALLLSHDSFWAYFGWMALPVGPKWYGALLLLTLVAALGWLFWARDQKSDATRHDFPSWAPKMMGVALLIALAAFIWVALLSQSAGFYQFQGRYLFPVVVPFAFLLIGGWTSIIPSRRRRILIGAVVVFLVLFDAWSVMRYVVPYFYF
jgi:hypothetical protein